MQERTCTVCDRALVPDERFVCKLCERGDFEAPSHSVDRRVAYALAIFPLDVVHRATIRALLPAGRIKQQTTGAWYRKQLQGKEKKSKNVVSYAYGEVLKRFDARGWVARGREFLLIKDRQPLMDYAVRGLETIPVGLLEIESAIQRLQVAVNEPGHSDAWLEQRRAELLALKRLMEQTPQSAGKRGTKSFRPVGLGEAM